MSLDPSSVVDLSTLIHQIADEGLQRVNTSISRALARGAASPVWATEKLAELGRLTSAWQNTLGQAVAHAVAAVITDQ